MRALPMPCLPVVHLIGQLEHPDFRESLALVAATSRREGSPELILVAQARPYGVSTREIERLRRHWPLAGVVGLLGTWCEGEARTGRPWPGVARVYWYNFPAWWRHQLALRAAGRCPDWARLFEAWAYDARRAATARKYAVLIHASQRTTAEALSEMLSHCGHAAIWSSPHNRPMVAGVDVGIWDGAQLDGREEDDLGAFCRRLQAEQVPVIAMLDFPRRDRCEAARELGAAVVIGKPWNNAHLLETISRLASRRESSMA